ncbi:hypothetical protein K466DRAFT_330744 [Polyporus arcularius HHB13444]|uniref:F-box domain-containing protein n=1 Tax=Polyporus arcularius HHB13444 TaxID=1314778 RepID=A0A5C3NWD3_9APHY|nr:hypothetical protein K466DRAFT_330744 [Polyporus arcularius HHB13444]
MPPGERLKELHALDARVLPANVTGVAVTGERPEGRSIQDMPVELLLEIFRIHATHCKNTSSRTAWLGILLVCSDWYRVACDASELWRVIHVGSNIDWLRLCLKRSARSLVDLHFSGLPTATIDAAVPLVIPHTQRVRAIHLTGHGQLSPHIYHLFAHLLPALEELSVLPAEWRSQREAQLVPWAQGYDAMRSLALSGVSIPRQPAFYHNLRSLELHECCCIASGFTIDDLVLALNAAASTLEELDLSRFDPEIPVHPQTLTPQLPDVHLKRLRGLYMDEHFAVVSRLCKHLTLPPDAFLHLRIYVTHADQLRYANGAAVLADIVPPGVCHVLESITDMAVTIGREAYSIRARNIPLKPVPPSFSSDGAPIDRVVVDTLGWKPDRLPGLRGILRVYTAGLLTSLSITLEGTEYPAAEWRSLFVALRLLEKLAIADRSHLNPTNAFNALSAPTGDPGSRHTEHSATTSSQSMLCPSLRALRLEGLVQRYEMERVFDALGRALRLRAVSGRRLEELLVDPGFRASGDTRVELEQRLDALKPLVGALILR